MGEAISILTRYGYFKVNVGGPALAIYAKRNVRANVQLYVDEWLFSGPNQRDEIDSEPIAGSYSLNGLSELEALVRNLG